MYVCVLIQISHLYRGIIANNYIKLTVHKEQNKLVQTGIRDCTHKMIRSMNSDN